MGERVPLALNVPVHPLPIRVMRGHTSACPSILPRLELELAALGDIAGLGAVGACRGICEGVDVAAEGFANALVVFS
jgi:hypothetical protein